MSADAAADGGRRPSEFETALDELERIVGRLDREELELDEALELFEEGVGHLRTASRLLDEARGVVEELIENASGELEAVDFDLPEDDRGTDGEG
jgi:exodeoxyribonuclease VII small subunit